MFDESKHRRDEIGRFTDMDTVSLKAEAIINTAVTKAKTIQEFFGEEFKGYKGQQAINKLLKEQRGHIKAAFHREDIGDIDLPWGDNSFGLKHIIVRRKEQKINIQDFLQDLSNVIEKGSFRKKNERGNFEFMLNNKIAIVSPELNNEKLTFLLTAFKTHSKK